MPISKSTRNFLALFLGTATVILGTVFLLASAIGWQYDFATGELRETGLILMNSEPTGAEIRVDNHLLSNVTPYRYTNVRPGRYEVKYNRNTFRPWVKQVEVAAERVSFADYAWLIPEIIPTRERYSEQNFTHGWQSYDRRRYILLDKSQPTAEPRLYTSTDLGRPPVLLYTPSLNPATALSGAKVSTSPVTTIDNVTFSADGSQILATQTHADGSAEWIVLPASQSSNPRVINLSAEINSAPSWVSWGPSGNNDIYVVQEQSLRRFTANDRKLSEVLINNVWSAMWSEQALITVESNPDAQATTRRLVARNRDVQDAQVVSSIPVSSSYKLQYFKILNDDYVAALTNDIQTLTITKGIFANKDQRNTSTAGTHITNFIVNRSGRYLVHNEKDRLVSIDFEQNQRYRFDTPLNGLTHWEWMNDQHLAFIAGSQLRLVDFDGQNDELISDTVTNPTSLMFAENKSLLAFTTANSPTAAKPNQLRQFFLNPERILE